MGLKYSIILSFMGQLKDRFSYYQRERPLDEKIALAAQVDGVSALELVYPSEIRDATPARDLLAHWGLRCAAVNVNLKGDPIWHQGALTARDPGIRAEAVRWLERGMDLAAELGSNLVTVCPLADGHDYPFEVDYRDAWRWFIEGIGAAADYRPEVRLSMEYKASEPRAHVILGNVGKALYACGQLGQRNVGITLDMGHALYVGESFAESVALLTEAGRLFLVHGNDNYRNWDWDLIPGYVNLWDLVEGIHYLRLAGYDGWVSFDVFPARLDPVETMRASLRMCQRVERLVERLGTTVLERSISAGDLLQTMRLVESLLAND